ncbi:efflux RND transporter permease subunit [Treponema sp. TIM-1]|uniref:efflux RND transporter permease subunit n=1 Tax=Treponema sp. TIM-1 TaxID=2898417 RepID=UPI0039817A84
MQNPVSWLQKPIAALCMIFALTVLSVFIMVSGGDRGENPRGNPGYTIILRHYGVNAREMERTAAIPLEDALSSIGGVKKIMTLSENGKVRAFVHFGQKVPGAYEAVREAAQGVYEALPSSAQRPELLSSDDSRLPLWTAAVFSADDDALGQYLERIVKPALEALDGAGEVEVSGIGLPEIVIALKPEEAASRGLDASLIAGVLGKNDLLLPGGSIKSNGRDILITLDGRYQDCRALADAWIPLPQGGVIRLRDTARVYEQNREPESFSRLNGKSAAVIAVLPGSDADPAKLSGLIRGELEKFTDLPLEFQVLSDRGAEETAAFGSVLAAALQGAAAVALLAALLGKAGPGFWGRRRAFLALVSGLTVPFICLLSAALLSLLGFSLDRGLLAGLSAGVGAAVDAAILSSEGLGKARTIEEGRELLTDLHLPLVSGSVTTMAALLPLIAMESLAGGISTLAWAIGTVTFLALPTALVLVPPLLLWGLKKSPGPFPAGTGARKKQGNPGGRSPALFGVLGSSQNKDFFAPSRGGFFLFLAKIKRKITRKGLRLLAAHLRFCTARPYGPLIVWGLVSAGGITALVLAGADVGTESSARSLYAQVEFEGGLRAEEADRLLAPYAEGLTGHEGVETVQTVARTASGSVLVTFDPRIIPADKLRNLVRTQGIPGGFVYIPEMSSRERIWEIKVTGDDDETCRELAEAAARLCGTIPLIRETVLNFKEGSRRLTLVPDRERLLTAGIQFSQLADRVRRGVHGPVAYKRISPQGETDVRIRGRGIAALSREEIRGLLVGSGTAREAVRLDSLVKKDSGPEAEPSGIRREDRRRIASISIRTSPMDPREVRDQVMAVLDAMELPPGYTLEFDRDAIAAAEALSGTVFWFLLALIFCYMVMAAENESFGIPLAVLSVVLPSLSVPALGMAASAFPITASAACAFVAVSGMAVNASVLITDEIRRIPRWKKNKRDLTPDLYRALRRKLPLLFATGGTTISGAAPFLFLTEETNSLIRNLSVVSVLGVGASLFVGLSLLPALRVCFSALFFTFCPARDRGKSSACAE